MSTKNLTLSRHLQEEAKKRPVLTAELSQILLQIAYSAKLLSRELARAALVGKLGLIGEKNPTGDAQKKLDVYASETILEEFVGSGLVAAMVSEELDEVKLIDCSPGAQYLLCIDPLDGSSNTDINGSIGTIFGIYRRSRSGSANLTPEFFRKGAEQIATGYVMYSISTVLVYTCGRGVYGFTLDRELGEFLLSHENIRCPSRGRSYSANLAHTPEWPSNLHKYIQYLHQNDPATGRPYSLRYTGALVADLHRILMEGGLYFYPPDSTHKEGKLRLLYECAPLGFLVEAAGGRAGTGTQPILEVQPESIHHRVPFVVGSSEDVGQYQAFLRTGMADESSSRA